jgi:hypothetical protein
MIDSNNLLYNRPLVVCDPVRPCTAIPVHLTYVSLICVLGVVSNIILLYADYKEWKKSKTPDKVLVFNLAISNIIAVLVGLPFHAVLVS